MAPAAVLGKKLGALQKRKNRGAQPIFSLIFPEIALFCAIHSVFWLSPGQMPYALIGSSKEMLNFVYS